jgi:hypothetical protein
MWVLFDRWPTWREATASSFGRWHDSEIERRTGMSASAWRAQMLDQCMRTSRDRTGLVPGCPDRPLFTAPSESENRQITLIAIFDYARLWADKFGSNFLFVIIIPAFGLFLGVPFVGRVAEWVASGFR